MATFLHEEDLNTDDNTPLISHTGGSSFCEDIQQEQHNNCNAFNTSPAVSLPTSSSTDEIGNIQEEDDIVSEESIDIEIYNNTESADLANVLVLGLSFMLLFSAFNTNGIISVSYILFNHLGLLA